MIITIDGPAGTGKTTVAALVAQKLKFNYFDTGAMYRALTFFLLKEKVSLKDQHALETSLDRFSYEVKSEQEKKRYFVGGSDVTEAIRSPDVTKLVSAISSLEQVRARLVALQREYGKAGNAVFEGRDMGTVVFPQAHLKVFLTARPAVRAERRYMELKDKFATTSQEEIMKEMIERDRLDSSREISPLKQADDAHLIDTSDLSIEDVVAEVVKLASKR